MTYKIRMATTMTAAAIATMATVEAARIIAPVVSAALLLKPEAASYPER
jgi:hypothetical protein